MSNPTIKITRTYTLPQSREGRGRPAVERMQYDADDGFTVEEWAVEILTDAGITRHNWGPSYVAEEPKITDYAGGEEMTAGAELVGFTEDQLSAIFVLMSGK